MRIMQQRVYTEFLAKAILFTIKFLILSDAKTSYDVTKFETELLPKWVAQYTLEGSAGNFSYHPHSSHPHPYAPSDIAHVLCFTDQLRLSEEEKDEWAKVINSFQREDGFFNNTDASGNKGGSLWHAAGYVTAGLSLIGRQPLRRNIMFERIAATSSLWEPTISAFLNVDSTPIPVNISSGCDTGYGCGQNIGSLVSWFIQTNTSTGGLDTYAPFIKWYFNYLTEQADSNTGLWCTDSQQSKHGMINCIGGSFHIDFVYQFVTLHPEYDVGTNTAFPFPAAQLNSSLSLQKKHGGWSHDGLAYINVDGIYQATRPSLQLGKPRWAEVEEACNKLMALVTDALNNETTFFGKVSRTSHDLPALVSAVAECQKHWPTMIKSVRPWKMCLDDIPYI